MANGARAQGKPQADGWAHDQFWGTRLCDYFRMADDPLGAVRSRLIDPLT